MIKPKGFCCPVAYVLEETASPGGLSSQMHLTFLQPGILGSDLPPEISPKKSISTVVVLKSKRKLVMRAESFREVIPGVPVDFPPWQKLWKLSHLQPSPVNASTGKDQQEREGNR